MKSELLKLLAQPSREIEQLFPFLRLEDSSGAIELIEAFLTQSIDQPLELFLESVLFSHGQGCWFDDGGPGLSEFFLNDNFEPSTVELEDVFTALGNRVDSYFSSHPDLLPRDEVRCVYQIINDWNRKVFLIELNYEKTEREISCLAICYSNSD